MNGTISCKRCLVTAFLVFVAVVAEGMVFNNVCLGRQYEIHKYLWRDPARVKTLFPLLILSNAVFAYFFTWIFAKGYESGKGGLGQGFRFALLLWPVASLHVQLAQAPFLYIPLRFFGFWALDGLLACLVAGIVAGLIYKPSTPS
ncbi:MAG: hypothetical protein HYZ73_01160 [Elusimicrobia bacterium]|nr:hypothetical protein [Elusimicrobiota bacterium]